MKKLLEILFLSFSPFTANAFETKDYVLASPPNWTESPGLMSSDGMIFGPPSKTSEDPPMLYLKTYAAKISPSDAASKLRQQVTEIANERSWVNFEIRDQGAWTTQGTKIFYLEARHIEPKSHKEVTKLFATIPHGEIYHFAIFEAPSRRYPQWIPRVRESLRGIKLKTSP